MKKTPTITLLSFLLILIAMGPGTSYGSFNKTNKDVQVLPVNDDTNMKLRVWTNKAEVNIGDDIVVYFTTNISGYLTLVDYGTSGGKETVIYPNPFSGLDNYVKAGERYSFPAKGSGFRFNVTGPVGEEKILAYITDGPNEIGNIIGLSKSIKKNAFCTISNGMKFKDIVVVDSHSANNWTTAETSFKVVGSNSGMGYSTSTVNTTNRLYVISIGADTGKLTQASSDARKFSRFIREHLDVPSANIHIENVTGNDATLEGIRRAFSNVRRKADDNATIIVYFSGHGSIVQDKDGDEEDGLDECFIPVGFNKFDASTTLLDDEFNAMIKKFPTKKVVCIIDACYSGSLTKGMQDTDKFYEGGIFGKVAQQESLPENETFLNKATSAFNKTFLKKSAQGTEYIVDSYLAAAKEDMKALEIKGEGGLFTTSLIQAAKSNGVKNLRDAFWLARTKVLERSKNMQTPVIKDNEGLIKALALK